MPGTWQRLHLSKSEELPPLLFKYTTNPKGYDLYLTDLTHLWSERLNFKEILKRADEESTTIDPTEDPEQFDVLLEKIGEALQSRPGSSITVRSGASIDSLELHVSTKLPAPLRPLKWPIYFSRECQRLVTEYLLIPLLREEVGWESRRRSLLEQIKQKDWVLSKLFDNIEALGIDLSAVFPSIMGLRGARHDTTLAQAAKLIKGVAPFDEQQWLKEVNGPSADFGLGANIVSELSDSAETSRLWLLTPAAAKWWENLDIHSTATTTALEKDSQQRKSPEDEASMETDGGVETEDDEFERQETPPGLKRIEKEHEKPSISQKKTKKKKEDPRSESSPAAPEPPSKASRGLGLGVIGKKKKPEKRVSLHPARNPELELSTESDNSYHGVKKHPPPASSTKEKGEGESQKEITAETETETDSDLDLESNTATATAVRPLQPKISTPPPPRPESPKPKKPGRLGILGGKKKEKAKQSTPPSRPQLALSPSPSKTTNTVTTTTPPPQPKPKRTGTGTGKMGVIGGKKHLPSHGKEATEIATGFNIKNKENNETGRTISMMPSSLPRSPSPAGTAGTETVPVKPKKEEPEELRREETEEKADRKREELKRQLEARSKAPAKKKRRF